MPEDHLIGSLFAGRYRVKELLGLGGMGSVYLAEHEVMQREVALKLLHPEHFADVKMMARFEREARAISRIAHPNVAQVFDFGHSEQGRPYMAMEHAGGSTLADRVAGEGAFSVPRALSVLAQIAEGLAAAHAAGVIHRDLKPRNVVLAPGEGGAAPVVKILDFGQAKLLQPGAAHDLTTLGALYGTPRYMSPEQIGGEAVDHRTDIYTLGVVAFEILVGRVLFDGSTMEIVRAHLQREPPGVGEASGRDDIPEALERLIRRCLAKAPEARFAQAAALAAELRGLEQM